MLEKYINELFLKRVFTFKEDSILIMNKVPFVMIPAKTMAIFVQTVTEDLGLEDTQKIAYDAGLIVGEEFIKEFNWIQTTLPGKMKTVKKMLEIIGFGNMNLKIWDTKGNRYLANITNHPVIDNSKKIYKQNSLVCPFYMAIYSAHFHKELGIDNCWLIETQCICKGTKFCEWSYNIFKDKQEEANKTRPSQDQIQ